NANNPLEFVSKPSRHQLVDNTAPVVQLETPGSPLQGRVILTATARDHEPGSGVESVKFAARASTGQRFNLGEASAPSPAGGCPSGGSPGSACYSRVLYTDGLPSGRYELSAVAEDHATNQSPPSVASVEVKNPVRERAVSASPATVVPPASHVTIIGAIPGSLQHETWAYGFTSAAPAEVNGKRLEYAAQGNPLVLLRYTGDSGWQIADVLRGPSGWAAYPLLKPSELDAATGVKVAAAMAPSGEAWLWLDENPKERGAKPVVGMFHRRAAGPGDPAPPFELDERSTESLHPLLENLQRGDELRVGEGTNKEVIGILTAPSIGKPLDYGFLEGEKWVRPESFETAGALPWNSSSSAILKHADVQGGEAGKGISAWGLFQAEEGGTPAAGQGLILGHLQEGKWTFPKVPLDALALTGALKGPTASVEPQALKADGA